MMRRALLALVVLTSSFVLAPPADAAHSAGWHWRHNSTPFEIRLVNGAQGAWRRNVDGAANRWNRKVDEVDFAVERGARGCGVINDAAHVCSGSFPGSWAGLTEVALNGSHVAWATVKLDNSASSAMRAVSCHELGHVLGLGHRPQAQRSSCMTGAVSSAQTKPDGHDVEHLTQIYRHDDGSGAQGSGYRVVRIYTYLER